MLDEWKTIEGFEEYEISRSGHVRTERPLIFRKPQVFGLREIKRVKINGYWAVCLYNEEGKKHLYIHRLLWHAFIGEIPEGYEIDHIDRDRGNCRLENLRLATVTQNQINKAFANNGGYRGVVKDNRPGRTRFRAYIRANRKKIQLGSYKTKEEAALAYNEAAKKYHGEFAILNILSAVRSA